MNKRKLLFLPLLSALLLVGCSHDESSSSSSMPKPDLNKFNQVVEDEDAKAWIMATYNNFIKLDAMEVLTAIESYSYSDVRKYIPKKEDINTQTIPDLTTEFVRKETRLNVDAKLDQKMTIGGLRATDPNHVKVAYSANNLYCSMTKPGLDPENGNTATLNDGVAETYIKDNKQYANLSDENIRNFFPYLLFAFGDYETIDLARQEANELPEKFYDPTPVFTDEDLPLNEKMTNVAGVSLDMALMKMINKNKEMDTRFLEFRSNGQDLKVQFRLRKDHLVKLATKMKDEDGKFITEENAKLIIDNFVVMNSFNIETIITSNYYVDYVDADIDLSVSVPVNKQETVEELDAIDSYSIDLLTHSWFNFQDPVVTYPEDLSSYSKHDIQMPEFNIPGMGGEDSQSPIEPF